jgi:hypothetical protein
MLAVRATLTAWLRCLHGWTPSSNQIGLTGAEDADGGPWGQGLFARHLRGRGLRLGWRLLPSMDWHFDPRSIPSLQCGITRACPPAHIISVGSRHSEIGFSAHRQVSVASLALVAVIASVRSRSHRGREPRRLLLCAGTASLVLVTLVTLEMTANVHYGDQHLGYDWGAILGLALAVLSSSGAWFAWATHRYRWLETAISGHYLD